MPVFLLKNRLLIPLAVASSTLSLPGHAAQPGAETRLDTVLVTADRPQDQAGVERTATPGSVTTLDGEQLHERSVAQLADMLRYVPGVWAESFNGNDDVFYSSRGSNLDATDYDKNGVKFLQDGLPVTAADGNNHNRALDPLNTRYVTIAHGANALAYGASTLGGAIDVTSPTARTVEPFSAALAGGSFGQWSARATLGGVSDTLDGLVSAETLQRDGYRQHSKEDRRNVYANFGWQTGDNVTSRLFATYSDYYAELPRELTRAQFEADPRQARADAIAGNHSKDVQTWRLAFRTTIANLAGGTLELGASHEDQSLYHPIVSGPFFSLLIDTDHRDTGAMLRYRRSAGAHALVFGMNYGFSKMNGGNYENDGGERGALMWTTDDDASSLELFALDHWNFAPRWTLVYGTQYVAANRDAGGFDAPAYRGFNPRLGLTFNITESSQWYASISRTYEPPTTFELTDDTTGGSTALKAMHGIVVETGLRGIDMRGTTHLNWDVSAYYTALRDEILSVDCEQAPGTSCSINIDRTTHAGIESLLGASHAIGNGDHRIEPLLSATLNAFSFDSDPQYGNHRLPNAPRFFVRGEVMYRHPSGLRIGPTFDVVGARYADFENSYRVGSHTLLGARADYVSGHWQVYAEARNLLARNYVAALVVKDEAAPTDELLHPGSPRSFYIGARYRF
jgi:iron complex outermembrane receptor protein